MKSTYTDSIFYYRSAHHFATIYGILLCGRPIGRIIYASRPSVCPSVRPFVRPVLDNTNQNWRIDVPHSTSKWNASFRSQRSKVKVTGCKHLQNLATSSLTGGSRRWLHTRPTPLLGLLYCRRPRPWADKPETSLPTSVLLFKLFLEILSYLLRVINGMRMISHWGRTSTSPLGSRIMVHFEVKNTFYGIKRTSTFIHRKKTVTAGR